MQLSLFSHSSRPYLVEETPCFVETRWGNHQGSLARQWLGQWYHELLGRSIRQGHHLWGLWSTSIFDVRFDGLDGFAGSHGPCGLWIQEEGFEIHSFGLDQNSFDAKFDWCQIFWWKHSGKVGAGKSNRFKFILNGGFKFKFIFLFQSNLSDEILGLPSLYDLGVTPASVVDKMPFELQVYMAYASYLPDVGEIPPIPDPPPLSRLQQRKILEANKTTLFESLGLA